MLGNPGAIAFNHQQRNQMYAFVRGNRRGLQDCFWNAALDVTSWQWDDRGSIPGIALTTSPSPVTSRRDENAPEGSLHIFAGGDDGALYERYWDGTAWLDWVNRGSPRSNPVESRPAVASLLARVNGEDPLFYYEVLVFIWSEDRCFRYSRHLDRWDPQPNVPQVVASEPAAIVRYLGVDVLCYVVGGDQNLYGHVSTDSQGVQWASRDLGRPGPAVGVALLNRPGLAQLGQFFRAVVVGEDFNLWAHSWGGRTDQTRGAWSVLGRPPDGVTVVGEVSPIVFRYDGVDYMYNFFRGNNGHLYEARWDGQDNVIWDDFGRPTTGGVNLAATPGGGNAALVSAPSAIRFDDQLDGFTKMYAFVVADDDHLHVCFWDGNTWRWNDLGSNPQD